MLRNLISRQLMSIRKMYVPSTVKEEDRVQGLSGDNIHEEDDLLSDGV
jgi:hypothetical protein